MSRFIVLDEMEVKNCGDCIWCVQKDDDKLYCKFIQEQVEENSIHEKCPLPTEHYYTTIEKQEEKIKVLQHKINVICHNTLENNIQ